MRLDAEAAHQLRQIARGAAAERYSGERVRALALIARLDDDREPPRQTLREIAEGDAPPEVRIQAVRSLARLDGDGAAQDLRRLAAAAEEHPAVALAAARGLAGLRVTGAADLLQTLAGRLAETHGDAMRASLTDLERLIASLR